MFCCDICIRVVEAPQECSNCNWLYCGGCIGEWLSKEKTCPRCRADFQGAKVNRFVMQTLNSLEFKCDKCGEKFTYEKRQAHWDYCGAAFQCSYEGCNETFKTIEELEKHWELQCPEADMVCVNCGGQTTRKACGSHSCDEHFKIVIEK